MLHDVLYALEVRQNLLLVVKCLKLGVNFNFHCTGCDIYLGTQFCGCDFFMDDLVIFDIAYSNNNNNAVSYMTTASDVDSVV